MKTTLTQSHNASMTPKLRFENFEGVWIEKRLGELFIERSERKGNKEYNLLSVTLRDGIKSQGLSSKRDNSSEDKTNYKVVRVNDIAYNTMRMWQGASGVSELEGIVSPAYTVVTPRSGSVDFFKHLFKQPRTIFNFYRYSQGMTSDTWNLKFKHFSEVSVTIPETKEEQSKIASFLDAIDIWQDKLRKERELLQQYKKGMVQKIFSQKVSFKDKGGEKFPAWGEVKLKEVLKEHKTRNTQNTYSEVFSVAKTKGVINQIEHLGRSYSAESLSNYKVIFPGDVVYTKSPTADFPFGIIKQNQTGRAGVVSTLYAVFTPTNTYIGKLLHEYFISWVNTYNYLIPLVQKGAKNTINIGNSDFLNGAKLALPVSELEQKMIVEFLESLDRLIEAKSQQIDSAVRWRHGLMQQLFI